MVKSCKFKMAKATQAKTKELPRPELPLIAPKLSDRFFDSNASQNQDLQDSTSKCFDEAKRQLEDTYKICIEKLLTGWEKLQEEHKEHFDVLKKAHFSETVKLNVGGINYQTSLLTLNSDSNSMLAHMFSGRYELKKTDDGSYFIDRDGECFRHVLNYLRNGEVFVKDEETRFQLLAEAEFYRLDGLADLIGYGFTGSSILNKRLRKILYEEAEKMVPKSTTGKWRMIYSGKRDGWSASDFHEMCDKITPTMVVIRSEFGNIFGGFTTTDWSGEGTNLDQHAFIFSLFSTTWKEPVFMKTGVSYANIKRSPTKGPSFGYVNTNQFDIDICSEPQKHKCSYIRSGNFANTANIDASNKFLAGDDKYFVTEMEVFTTMEEEKIEKLFEKEA